jgi:hypothetical protein
MKKLIIGTALLAVSGLSLAGPSISNVDTLSMNNALGGQIIVFNLSCPYGAGVYTATTLSNHKDIGEGCAQFRGDSIVVYWNDGTVDSYPRSEFANGNGSVTLRD